MPKPGRKHWWQYKTVGEMIGFYTEAQSEAVLDLKREQNTRKRNDRKRRNRTVAGAVVGGLVAGPVGAVGLGVAENVLNGAAPRKLTIEELNERHRAIREQGDGGA